MAADPYRYFRIESRELLEQLSRGALDLESGASPAEVVARLLRLAHTLKGAARVVKEVGVAELAHAIEGELATHRESASPVPRGCIDRVLAALDRIGARLAELGPGERAEAPVLPGAAPIDAGRALRVDLDELDGLLESAAEAHAALASLRSELGPLEQARHGIELLLAQLAALEGPQLEADGKLVSIAEELRGWCAAAQRGFVSGAERIDRELAQLREAAERLRLVPVGALFTALERTLRDVAQQQGVRARFEGSGGEVRLDAPAHAALHAALVQLVRNAVAHGIEPEAERAARGKPAEGRVQLEVVRVGAVLTIRCRDDGRGVDLEAVRAAARRKGLAAAQAELSADQVAALLLGGGLSTSSRVTEISGRGIGLDVVREALRQLGGEVSLHSEPGRGASFELRVPIRVSAFDALLVEAGGACAGIPLSCVRASRQLGIRDVVPGARGASLLHDGRAIPFLSLARVLRLADVQRASAAVVIEAARGAVALGVERVRGIAGVVLRALPPLAPAAAFVAGVSLAADGRPQLLLDADGLVAEALHSPPAESALPVRRLPILVVDDSLTTRMLEQSILESAGYEVDLACSAEEALEVARRRRYGLFLVDVEMPGMDGFSFVERTRADPLLRETPAILVSSRSSPEDRRRGREAGARAHIDKGQFDQRELLEHIRRCLG